MSLNVRRFGVVWFSVLIFTAGAFAQLPTSGDVMRDRIKKAKALVAVKNYNAAIYELEGIRRETNEPTVNSVAQVMLMSCYLEQSDYKRVQTLLTDVFNAKKSNRLGGDNYYAVAGQIVRGAKIQLDRYKALGLMVSDVNLPADAVADINKMRETVETVITQSKALGATKKETSSAMALLEEASTARSNLARDDYDAKHWKDEVADARDSIMNSRSVVDAVGDGNAANTTAAITNAGTTLSRPAENTSAIIPVADKTVAAVKPENKPETAKLETAKLDPKSEPIKTNPAPANQPQDAVLKTEDVKTESKPPAQTQTVADANQQGVRRMRVIGNSGAAAPETSSPAKDGGPSGNAASAPKSDAPLAVGSLIEYATAKVSPTYPPAAKTMRTVGTVRVELMVDEQGKPEIQNTSGPGMLKQAAQDAVKKWKFKPFTRDGQPVKATGYVSFNFDL